LIEDTCAERDRQAERVPKHYWVPGQQCGLRQAERVPKHYWVPGQQCGLRQAVSGSSRQQAAAA
jgi:hypothetical protein